MIVFAFLYLVVITISIFFTYVKFKKIIQVNTIFTILWSFIGLLSIYNNLPIKDPRIQIHWYVLSSIIIFNILFLVLCKPNNRPLIKESFYEYKVNYKIIYLMNVLALLMMSPHIISAFITILQSGFASVRDVIYVSINQGSAIEAILTRTLPFSIFTATSLIAAVELVQNKRKLLPIALLGIFTYTLTFGGRFALLNFIVYYFASYFLINHDKKIKLKKRYLILGLVGLVVVTSLRNSSGMSVIEMGILYFVGSLSYLEAILDSPEVYGLTSSPMYGYLTLGFIIEPIILALKFIGLDLDVPSYIFNYYAQPWANIGDSGYAIWYNNNTTMFYTFLLDFREFGILIGTSFIAIIASLIKNSYTKYGNIRSLCLLVYIIGIIVNSPIKYALTDFSPLVIVGIIIITIKKSKKKKNLTLS